MRNRICWRTLFLLIVSLLTLSNTGYSQGERFEKLKQLRDRFDADGDGRLSSEERANLQKFLQGLRQKPQSEDIPASLIPGKTGLYGDVPGRFTLKVIESHELPDERRGKVIPLRITFPAETGSYPLIVHCHGAGGSKENGQPLVQHWVSHGYVVIQPTFGDSISNLSPQERQQFESIGDFVSSAKVTLEWKNRPDDVKAVLDSLTLLEKTFPELEGRIDTTKIGVSGHSYGAHTTMLLSGMTMMLPGGQSLNLKDDRIQAAVMISPQGPGNAIQAKSYSTISPPTLMITGDNDGTPQVGKSDLKGEWRKQAYDGLKPGDKYLLWINDAYHNFGGISGSSWSGAGPSAPDQVLLINSTVIAFFDAYLKKIPEAQEYLKSDSVKKLTHDLAHMQTK